MSELAWIIPAIISALAAAGMVLVNEYIQVRSLHLLFWMRLISVLFLLPWVLTFNWPDAWQFYVLMLLNAFVIAYSDIVMIGLTAKSGAGITSRLTPLIHGIIFIFWLAVTPSLLVEYIDKPLRSIGIVLSLATGIWFALRLKKCRLSYEALKIALPALVVAALAIVFGRLALNYADGPGAVYKYVMLQCLLVFICYFLFQLIPFISVRLPHMDLRSGIFDRRVLLAGMLAAIAWLISTPAKWYAIMQVENPAYVTMFALSVPLWVLLAYRFTGRKEKADISSGLGIVASAMALIFFTQF